MSVGTDVRSAGITSPFFSDGPLLLRGTSWTNCSPTDDTLCTSALRSAGILTFESSDSTACTPLSVRLTLSTMPTCAPR